MVYRRWYGLVLMALACGGSAPRQSQNPGSRMHVLTVTVSGGGMVTSSPAGISCTATCAASFVEGTAVSLSAAASTGSTFAGWGGACSGSGACSMVLKSDASVTARFSATAPPQQTFVLTVKMNGSGSVDSSPAGIACGQACTARVA